MNLILDAYPMRDVLYTWKSDEAVSLSPGVVLSQYDFVNISQSTRNYTIKVGGKK